MDTWWPQNNAKEAEKARNNIDRIEKEEQMTPQPVTFVIQARENIIISANALGFIALRPNHFIRATLVFISKHSEIRIRAISATQQSVLYWNQDSKPREIKQGTILGTACSNRICRITYSAPSTNPTPSASATPTSKAANSAAPADSALAPNFAPVLNPAPPMNSAPATNLALPANSALLLNPAPLADSAYSTDSVPSADSALSEDSARSADSALSADSAPSADSMLSANSAPSADSALSADSAPSLNPAPAVNPANSALSTKAALAWNPALSAPPADSLPPATSDHAVRPIEFINSAINDFWFDTGWNLKGQPALVSTPALSAPPALSMPPTLLVAPADSLPAAYSDNAIRPMELINSAVNHFWFDTGWKKYAYRTLICAGSLMC
ncbi:hypothetical protein GJ744_009078 [Endocarpon pusillum]|uniref:Uncharacterized protein n=1 Tax=Endocarpon pusillum TaxID=364733 RepID=A0A8H7A4I5_9EURO|nr:hypothetical protein GJ744_009078 [Endocarpon pusillum]